MDHRSRYQGKNLLYLLLAFGVPVLLLYCAFTASVAAQNSMFGRDHIQALAHLVEVFSVLFYGAQFAAAWYLRRAFFPAPSSRAKLVLAYLGFFVGGLLCSLCCAVVASAFGYEFLLRAMRRTT